MFEETYILTKQTRIHIYIQLTTHKWHSPTRRTTASHLKMNQISNQTKTQRKTQPSTLSPPSTSANNNKIPGSALIRSKITRALVERQCRFRWLSRTMPRTSADIILVDFDWGWKKCTQTRKSQIGTPKPRVRRPKILARNEEHLCAEKAASAILGRHFCPSGAGSN